MKQPRKVALVNVADYPREKYSAYWHIVVLGDDVEGYLWRATIDSYTPTGFLWEGKVHDAWPTGVPRLAYPDGGHLARDAEYARMTPAQQALERARQEAYRQACSKVYEAQPKATHLLEESSGTAATRDEADTAAQQWVIGQMAKHQRPMSQRVSGYAIPLPVDLLSDVARSAGRALWRLLAPFLLMALAYSTTVRNNRLHQVRDAIDGGAGAGLLRIYDGSRPATCGTATTLLAELTFTDPCAGAASGGVLTMSAITQDSSANATGTATWFRAVDSTGTCCIDGNCGTSGSDMNMNSTSINTGVAVACSSFVITGGNA